MRIGFLFNHDQLHQVAHLLPVALALASKRTKVEIVIATVGPHLACEVARLGGSALRESGVEIVRLSIRRTTTRLLAGATNALVPTSKVLVYRDNLSFFRSLDILVVAEKTSLLLKTRYGLEHLRIVHTRHGAGDRAIGFDAQSAGFDHVLVSGAKIRNRLIGQAGVDARRISVTGYPKFDCCWSTQADLPKFDRERPVVLYNPHVSPHLSSWYRMGRPVLDWFLKHEEYQLIFAPHVMLFARRFVATIDRLSLSRAGRLARRYQEAPNIHVDLGSRACSTMAYTNRADIYLGDVSSQVYEFVCRPRPCVFLDAHDAMWRDNPDYLHWTMGPVIRQVQHLGNAFETAQSKHLDIYRPIQERLFRYSIDLSDCPSAERGAEALLRFAGLPAPNHSTPPPGVSFDPLPTVRHM